MSSDDLHTLNLGDIKFDNLQGIDEKGKQAAEDMVRRRDELCFKLMRAHFGEGFTLEDIAPRCCLLSRVGSGVETLCFDGEPVAEFHRMAMETYRDPEHIVVRFVQPYRIINRVISMRVAQMD